LGAWLNNLFGFGRSQARKHHSDWGQMTRGAQLLLSSEHIVIFQSAR
jgi:hypothetical protein